MIITITLNPCLDRIITVDGLKLDEANRWKKLSVSAGGKGIDVSRAIHEMGGRSTAYGFIGGTAGRTLEILLDEEGVPYNFTPIEQETRTNFIITDTRTNRQTRIDSPGPRISKREFERFHHRIKRIKPRPELIIAGGSVPPGLPTNIYYDIIMEAKELGVKTILDS
ncbi:MAG: PfkB family carbohydrate kinase, partial [Dehalococcoidales bacterium]